MVSNREFDRKGQESVQRKPQKQEKQRRPNTSRGPSRPTLLTHDGQRVVLENVYRGCPAFLLCGGPSLITHDLQLLQQRGILTCAVNNAAAIFRPHLWVCVDSPGNFCDTIWRDPGIIKIAPSKHLRTRLTVRDASGTLQASQDTAGEMPAVFGFERNDTFVADRWLYEETFNWGNAERHVDAYGNRGSRSVMYAALRLLFYLGVRELYLLGCDFHMERGKSNYAFPQRRSDSSIRSNNRTYQVFNDRLRHLLPYFEKEGYRVVNCTPNSGLTVFPTMPFEAAVAQARSRLPSEIVTEGMYDRNKTKNPPQNRPKQVLRPDKTEVPKGSGTGSKTPSQNHSQVLQPKRMDAPTGSGAGGERSSPPALPPNGHNQSSRSGAGSHE